MNALSQHALRTGRSSLTAGLVLLSAVSLEAHPTPFTYADVRLAPSGTQLTISAHVIDAAHDLAIADPTSLIKETPSPLVDDFGAVLLQRLDLHVDGGPLACTRTTSVERLPDTQSLQWVFACALAGQPHAITLAGPLFPYDPEHHTFINVYVDEALRAQADLTGPAAQRELSLSASNWLGTISDFTTAGVHHILAGTDHLLFLAGLLLAGGSLRRLMTIVTAFTIAHSITLAAAVLDLFAPPASLVEPLIALSIVAVGLDNLRMAHVSLRTSAPSPPGTFAPSDAGLSHTARDRRALAAGSFGLVHGFGFASVLREMQLRRGDLVWSLASFNVGVELGQLAVVACVTWLFLQVRRLGPRAERHLVLWGSCLVIAAGAFWFVERVFSAR